MILRTPESKRPLYVLCFLYLAMSGIFASSSLDIDEFGFIREPYELLGGDYTVGYLRQHDYAAAARTMLKSYHFYWKYRPLFSPLISKDDQRSFEAEEQRFGYVKPQKVAKGDAQALAKYQHRLVVPEPDRFYSHGAGKPLLSAIVSIPQLALVGLFTRQDRNLLYYQYRYNYHPIFIVTRLVQILSGLATILLVYWILAREYGAQQARFGAAMVALFPIAIAYFPNIHHDALLPPLLVLAAYLFIKQRYWVAGIFLGLALASKNTATLLLPVFAFEICWNAWRARTRPADGTEPYALVRHLKGFAVTAAVALLVLLPFANPVSYAQEVLTPIMRPARDLRGENVEGFSLSARLHGASDEPARTSVRPEIHLVRLLLRFDSDDLFFLVIAFFLFWSSRNDPLTRVCFVFLLMAFPYGVIFGHDLNYRSLQFVPFFALLCGRLAPRGHYAAVVAVLLGIDVLYCIDPITANSLHTPANTETFIGALQKSLGM
jgi:hypothetical protein